MRKKPRKNTNEHQWQKQLGRQTTHPVKEKSEAPLLGAFERFEILVTAIKQLTQIWML